MGSLEHVKREYWDWEQAHWDWLKNAGPCRDAALYFSLTTRDFYGPRPLHVNEYYGWSEALLEENQPFDAIIDRFREDLSQFRVIILPTVAAIPPDMAQRLEKYVADGGTVIATCETGSHSGLAGFLPPCSRRPSKAPTGKSLHIADKRLAAILGATEVPYSDDFKDCSGAGEPLISFGGVPCAVVQKHGAGRVIYLGFYPGMTAYLRHVEREEAYSATSADLANTAAMWKLIKALTGDYVGAARMHLTNLPEGVAVFLTAHSDGARRWLNVHLINATKSAPKPGMLLPMSYEIPADKVAFTGASIRLALPPGAQVAEVRMLTLDKDASKEFDWSVAGGGVVLNPRDLVRYSIFCIVLK
jgi:hypothetical protein